ncbi:MAG: AraC family transcriptional regulator [Spirochaetales bacterium]|nr:AraC family transcriptional regulator [Spirochaetales bacterium]
MEENKNIDSNIINQAIEYIFEHIDEDICVDDVASHCAYSKYHLMRLFKEHTDEALYQFIKRIRLERSALKLKIEKERSITDIGIDYGYSSSNFATAFKKQLNVSPTDFRRNSEEIVKKSSFYQEKSIEEITNPSKLISIEYLSPIKVLYERQIGNYHDLPLAWNKFLDKYASFIDNKTTFIECTIDDPTITDEDKCMFEICLTVPDSFNDDTHLIKTFEGGKYAVYHFKGYPQYMFMVYQKALCNWLYQTGNRLDERPTIDIYRLIRADGYMEIDICFPIK